MGKAIGVWVLAVFLMYGTAAAQVQCAGSLTQQQFMPEIKELNQKVQKNILDYRKLQASAPRLEKGSPEAVQTDKRMSELMAEIEIQKKTFKQLNSPQFPTTALTALGAACSDRRWVERGKEILIKQPDKLGRHYFVWFDSTSREVRASEERPKPEQVAK